jgi:hypothetical protein
MSGHKDDLTKFKGLNTKKLFFQQQKIVPINNTCTIILNFYILHFFFGVEP